MSDPFRARRRVWQTLVALLALTLTSGAAMAHNVTAGDAG